MTPLNLPRALEAALAAEPDGWARDKLHVSDTRHALKGEGCPRQLYLRLAGAEEKPEPLGNRLRYDHGRQIHRRVVALLETGLERTPWAVTAIEQSVARELKTSGIGIERGRLDVELEHVNGKRVVVELKSAKSWAFKHLDKEGPKRPHVVQAQTYAMMREAAGALVVYADREGAEGLRQYPVPRDDATVRRAAKVLTAIKARHDSPPRLQCGPKGKLPWQCNFCSFYGASCKGAV